MTLTASGYHPFGMLQVLQQVPGLAGDGASVPGFAEFEDLYEHFRRHMLDHVNTKVAVAGYGGIHAAWVVQ